MSEDESQEDVADSPAATAADSSANDESSNGTDTRRRFFEIASLVLGGLVSIGPALIGLIAFLDPLRRKPAKPLLHREEGGGGDDGFIRVASLDALVSGTPQRFAVIDDKIDSWNFTPDQPIGSVYIQKPATDSDAIRVFNTTCPHAGCSVSCDGEIFKCPCHNSSFELDGAKRTSAGGRANPSPRELDTLEHRIDENGEIWVEFKNFYTGTHDKKEKA
jgi:Rieske Fe-S protein